MSKIKPWKQFTCEDCTESLRVDKWLSTHIDNLSRRQSQKLLKEGAVSINGKKAQKSDLLSKGDSVIIWSPPVPKVWFPKPDPNVTLNIIHEDPDFIALNKPTGLNSVPISPRDTNTLAQGIAAQFPECLHIRRSNGDVGLIQRLDRETSGIVLAARNQQTFDRFLHWQQDNQIEKTYLALVEKQQSELPKIIDMPLQKAGIGSAMVKPKPDGVPSITTIKKMVHLGKWLLVSAVIYHGSRHQIRAHLAHAGFPIAGDSVYHGKQAPKLERLFLHAHSISFLHPKTNKPIHLTSPLPEELEIVLNELKEQI